MSNETHIFSRLMAVIEDRKRELPERSYTTRLFEGGVPKIGAKLTEEAAEAVEAAAETGEAGRQHLIHEAADVVYHLFVLLGFRDVSLVEVEQELAARFGISGLDEKASRTDTLSHDRKEPRG
jgi:phosphoribosyl-ATP pyrophosphohydrolase